MKIRLNRYLSECGVASRRKADDLIKYGEIIVNGKYVAERGSTVDPERDTIELNGEIIKPEKKRYLILIIRPIIFKKPLRKMLLR